MALATHRSASRRRRYKVGVVLWRRNSRRPFLLFSVKRQAPTAKAAAAAVERDYTCRGLTAEAVVVGRAA